MAALAVLCVGPVRAEEPQQALDAEFLDYLLKYEGKETNWTVVAEGKVRDRVRALSKKDKGTSQKKDQPQDTQP